MRMLVRLSTLTLAIVCYGCASSKTTGGGTAIGATVGAVVGDKVGNKTATTALGAYVGSLMGRSSGPKADFRLDSLAEDIRRNVQDTKVERVGRSMKVSFNPGVLFDARSPTLQPAALSRLSKLAASLNKYPDAEILIEGHTDSSESREYDVDLSVRWAQLVAHHLSEQAVATFRMHFTGYGPDQPVVSNSTEEGRQMNRRVDLLIFFEDESKTPTSGDGR